MKSLRSKKGTAFLSNEHQVIFSIYIKKTWGAITEISKKTKISHVTVSRAAEGKRLEAKTVKKLTAYIENNLL
jgi:hypothetical protein